MGPGDRHERDEGTDAQVHGGASHRRGGGQHRGPHIYWHVLVVGSLNTVKQSLKGLQWVLLITPGYNELPWSTYPPTRPHGLKLKSVRVHLHKRFSRRELFAK